MAPNLRPTLSTRIRASFDGKKSKPAAQKPQETNTFVVQDAATLRDAIGQAISNSSFQSAIAAHLARLIEPSIKDALDTIQPVVETVYQHDVLLRKTNRSVEDLLQRFDSAAEKEDHENADRVSKNVVGAEDIKQLLSEHSVQNSAKIEELSGTLREGHATTARAGTDIAEIKASLSLLSKNLDFLTSTAQQSSTDNFKLQEQLDEVKVDISNILKSIETQGGTLTQIKEADLATVQILGDVQQSYASHALALNEIKAHDQSFKSASIPIFEKTHADTATAFQALTANLAALKENVKAGFASETDTISALGAKVDKVFTSVDTISGNDSGHEILSAVRKSNDFHTIHVTALDGIMDRLATPNSSKDVPAENDGFTAVKEHLNTIANTLDSHTNHLTAMRDDDKGADILAAVLASNESHVAHGAHLGEIRATAKAIEQSHTSHTADLAEIKAAVTVAGESHTSHTKNFEDLQAAMTTANESHASHTMALETIKATNDNGAQGVASHVRSLEALGTQMGTVIATLGSQSIVHSDIRDTVHASQEAHTTHSADLGEIKKIVKAAGESHTTHAAALDGLKSRQEGTIEQLTAHTANLDGVQEQIGTVIKNIGEQTTMHSEIRDAVHTSNASHATHTKTLDEIIAAHNSSNTQLAKQTTTLDAVSSQLSAITETLDHQGTTHSQLLDAVQTSNASHESHAAALDKAESAHADILGGVNVSRELLVGHKDILTSHARLLEHVRDAHSKNHSDVMDVVKQSHELLESQAGTLRGMDDKHEEIRNSVQALGGGVNPNESGLGQPRDHIKVPAAAETSESVPAMTLESNPSDSLQSKKSILGLGMATVAGGGLLAVASSEGLFPHGSEVANEQIPPNEKSVGGLTTGVEVVNEVKAEDTVQDLVTPPEQVKQVDSSTKVTGHVGAEKPEPAERVDGVFDSTQVEADEIFDSAVVEKPTEPVEETLNSNHFKMPAGSEEETFDPALVQNPVEPKGKNSEPVETVKSAEPAEEDAQVEGVKSVEPVGGGADQVEVFEPMELVQQEGESARSGDVAVDEVHRVEPISGLQLVGREEPALHESIHEREIESVIGVPAIEEPTPDERAINEPVIDDAVIDELTIDEPAFEESAVEVVGEPTTEVIEEPNAETVKEPTIEDPVIEDQVIGEPAMNEPVVEEPTVEESTMNESAIQEPAVEKFVVEESAIQEPAVEEPTVKESAIQEPAIQEPAIQEPTVEEPAVEESAIQESAVEEPTIDEPVVEDPVADMPAVEESSSNETIIHESSHDTIYENEKDPLQEEPKLRTNEATEKAAEVTEFVATEVGEPAAEAVHEAKLSHEVKPTTEYPAIDREISYDAKSKLEKPITDEPGFEELSSFPQSSPEHSLRDADQILEEPFQDSASDHTLGVSKTDKPIHDEVNKEPTPEQKESSKESPVEEGPNQNETALDVSEMSREVEVQRAMRSATNENHLIDATVDGPAYESETLAENIPKTKEEPLNPPLQTHVLKSADELEHVRDDSALGYESAAIGPTVEPTVIEPDFAENEGLIISEPAAMIDATLESRTPQSASLREINSHEIEHSAKGPSVKHELPAEDIAVKQLSTDTQSAQLDNSWPDDSNFDTQGGGNSQPILGDQPGIGDPIPQKTDLDPPAVESPVLEQEKEATEAPPTVEAQSATEIDQNFKNIPEDLFVAGPATMISENTELPTVNTEEIKPEPSNAVDSVATEAVQTDDAVSTELEEVHKMEPSPEAKPIVGEYSIEKEAEPQSESGIDVKKDVLENEAPQEEPVLEKTFVEDQTADGLALGSLAMSDRDAIPNNMTSDLGDESPPIELVTMESAMRTRNGGTERRPSLMKRVSFKEPPVEVKSTPENDAEAECLSTRETIMEELHNEAGTVGDESTINEPLVEVQDKGIAADDGTAVETPVFYEILTEGEPVNQGPATDSVPTVASKPPAEGNSAELKPSKHETPHLTSERPLPESEQISHGELPPAETEPIIDVPSSGNQDNESSPVQSDTKDNHEVTLADAKPMVQQDLAQLTTPHIEPTTELEQSANDEKAEKVSAGDNIGDFESVAENTNSGLKEEDNSEIEFKEGNETSSDRGTVQNSAVEGHHLEDSDKPDLTQHILISDGPTEEPQDVVAVEEPITEHHVVSTEHPLLVSSPVTEELNENSSEHAITDEPAASGLSIPEHMLDQPPAEAMKYDSVADDPAPEEPRPEAPGATAKDLAEEKIVSEVTAEKMYPTESPTDIANDPAQETPVVHIPSVDSTLLEKTSEIGTKHEETTMTKPIGSADEAAAESTVDIPAAESDPTQAKVIAEELALHEKTAEDIVENPTALSAPVYEPGVHEPTKGILAETEATEDPAKEHSLIEKPPGELSPSSEVVTADEMPTGEPSEIEPLQETYFAMADTPTGTYLTEKNSIQAMQDSTGNQGEPTAKGSNPNAQGSEKEDTTLEEPLLEAVSLEGKTGSSESAADEPANEINSTAEEAGLKAEKTPTSAFEDGELAAVIEPTSAKSDIPNGPPGESGTQVKKLSNETERVEAVVYTTEPESNSKWETSKEIAQAPGIEATEKETVKEEPLLHKPVDLEAPATHQSVADSLSRETASSEPTDCISMEDPTFVPPLNVQPTRVDSGIDVETPTDVKSGSKVEPLDTLVEDLASADTLIEKSSFGIAAKEPVMEDSTVGESIPEHKPQKKELIGDESTIEGHFVEAEPVADEARKEIEDTVDEPSKQDQFFDAVDEPSSKKVSTATIEPSARTESAANKTNGNPLEEDTLVDPVRDIHGEKEIQISTKSNTKEQHTRVDSGIDVETPMKEQFGKLQSVVEVTPALDIEQGL